MNYKLIVTNQAHEDLRHIVLWYNEQQSSLGNEFIIETQELINGLLRNPYINQIRKKGIRYALLNRFPYLVIYEIINKEVVVYSVVHGKKNSKRKYQRRIKK